MSYATKADVLAVIHSLMKTRAEAAGLPAKNLSKRDWDILAHIFYDMREQSSGLSPEDSEAIRARLMGIVKTGTAEEAIAAAEILKKSYP